MKVQHIKVVQIPVTTEAEIEAALYAITARGWRLINVLPDKHGFLAFFERQTPA